MSWTMQTHADGDALAGALADALATIVDAALSTRGSALLALAGGRTPLPAYRALATRWRTREDASTIVVMPTDDRCVPHDHPASNVGELRAIFGGSEVRVEALTTAKGDAERSTRYAAAMLADHPTPFDAVVLGMGLDAHTASLFPGAPQLAAALRIDGDAAALRIDPDPLPADAPFARITLTRPRLLRTHALILAIAGDAKRAVLDGVLADARTDAMRRPIAALLHAPDVDVRIHWSP